MKRLVLIIAMHMTRSVPSLYSRLLPAAKRAGLVGRLTLARIARG